MDREQHNQRRARQSFQLACNCKSIRVRELDIENDQVGIQIGGLIQRFGSIRSISYDSQAGFIDQQPAQAFPNRGSIIDDQDTMGSS